MRRLLIASLLIVLSATTVWSYFKLARTGEEAGAAAKAFLASLDDKQQKSATFAYDDAKRVAWHFIPLEGENKEREGLQIRHMNEAQRKAATATSTGHLSMAPTPSEPKPR